MARRRHEGCSEVPPITARRQVAALKSEVRSPKSEGNPNTEVRSDCRACHQANLLAKPNPARLRVSGFGLPSVLGFRTSDFRAAACRPVATGRTSEQPCLPDGTKRFRLTMPRHRPHQGVSSDPHRIHTVSTPDPHRNSTFARFGVTPCPAETYSKPARNHCHGRNHQGVDGVTSCD